MDVQARYDEIVDDLLARHPDAERTKMMGMQSVKKNGKLVLGLAGEGAMTFKLPDPIAHGEALKLSGSHLFDPGGNGHPFRDWVVIPPEHADEWPRFAELALGLVGNELA
jgi:hypothetical protein